MNRKVLALACVVLFLAVGIYAWLTRNPAKPSAAEASAAHPCGGSAAPAEWKHVLVLVYENKDHAEVIGDRAAPFITGLAAACGTAYSGEPGADPKNNWHDADYKVDGSVDGHYNSKPNYATYASGVSPSVHGILNDAYETTTDVDNVFNQMNRAGKTVKSYYHGPASETPCASPDFSGSYHDAMRYFSNLGGHSTDPTTFCNTHDVPLENLMSDLSGDSLPAFAMVFPTNEENMHNNSVASGDNWARAFLTPIFDSPQYRRGDIAIFFVWDEDTAIPNVLIAPSIVPGSKVPAPVGNPISHFAALRTWDEMLGLPPLADAAQAPSLLGFFNGEAASR